jgi:hypothetical protein
MNTNKIVYACALFLVIGLCGCDDYLNRMSRISQTDELTLSTFSGINKSVIGAYSPLYDYMWYGRDFVVTADIKGGNGKLSPKNSGRFRTDCFWNNTPTSTCQTWQPAYALIDRVNKVLKALDGFSEPGVTTDELKAVEGEAKFLRALAYHDLVRMYAQDYYPAYKDSLGVPVVLTPSLFGKPARNTVEQVYTQIVKDLKDAEAYLPTASTHSGQDAKAWATQRAAQALLARVYLYMGEWQKAADYATLVMDQQTATFRLFKPEEFRVWGTSASNGVWGALTGGSEVIFEVFGSEGNSSHGNWDVISYILSPDGYGDVGASNDLRSLYTDTSDVRGKLFCSTDKYPTDFWTLKYPGKDGNLREDNIPVLRLSEMYLIRAEALLNGAVISGATALKDLNDLRVQRKAKALTSATLNDVYLERRRELCFEGHELFDLSRTHRDLVRNDYSGSSNKDVHAGDYKWAMPIPQDEINANPNCKQNSGYSSN